MLLVPRQGREGDALIPSAAHSSQLCLLLPPLPGIYWRCECFLGGLFGGRCSSEDQTKS